ncbi:MAG: AraC family transcriptional regulator [Verrucomicrobiota bacterium]
MSKARLFGDGDSSPLWAVSCHGSSDEVGIPVPEGSIAIAAVSQGNVGWRITGEERSQMSGPATAVILNDGKDAQLYPREDSEILVVGFHRQVFTSLVEQFREELATELKSFLLQSEKRNLSVFLPINAPVSLYTRIVPEFLEPPSEGAARSFWYEGQIRLLVSLVCFRQPGQSGSEEDEKVMRDAVQRVNKTKKILGDQLERNLGLAELSAHVGCSGTHLCRTFSKLTGLTISQYLRRCRILRATELLSNLDLTIGEVARRVGYRSMSHFTKAFVLEKGYLPSEGRRIWQGYFRSLVPANFRIAQLS